MIRTLLPTRGPLQKSKVGFGFLGCIMYDDNQDTVQCHNCGKWLHFINGRHLLKEKMTADEYRLKFGLTFNHPLCGLGLSKKRRRDVSKKFMQEGTKMRIKLKGKQALNKPARHVGMRTESQRNRFGTCDRQLRARYDRFKIDIGHPPSTQEFRNRSNRSLLEAITRRHGSLNAYREIVGDPVLTKSDQNRIRAKSTQSI